MATIDGWAFTVVMNALVEQERLADAPECGDVPFPRPCDVARGHTALDLFSERGRPRQDVDRQLLVFVLVRRRTPGQAPRRGLAKRSEERDAGFDRAVGLPISNVDLAAAAAGVRMLVKRRL